MLAEWLAEQGISVLVSVATEYGRQALKPGTGLAIRTGRLDMDGMEQLLCSKHPRIVLDATHPHAQEVTRLLKQACEHTNVRYERVVRGAENEKTEAAVWVDTAAEAAKVLEEDRRAVLLTTGSKELEAFASVPELRGRIYARVLPDSKVLASCESLGIRGRQLIAMQGPFSVEMNEALLRAVDAGWLVTKESGTSGGFEEKLEAAERCGARAVVIRRPQEEGGLTIDGAKRLMRELFAIEQEYPAMEEAEHLVMKAGHPAVEPEHSVMEPECSEAEARQSEMEPEHKVRRLSLIGMGMGMGSQLTQEAIQALRESGAVLGASRMLEDIRSLTAGKRTEAVYMGKEIAAWLGKNRQYDRIAVVYSGDTGFYSGAASLIQEFETDPEYGRTLQFQVYPGISTVSCLCARFHLSWESLFLASAHGKDCDVVRLLKEHPRVFLLLGGALTVSGVCRSLTEAGLGSTQVFAGTRLGYKEEQLFCGTAKELQAQKTDGLAAVILERRAERTDSPGTSPGPEK